MSVCAPLVLPVLSSQRLEQLPANPAQPVPLVLLMVLQTVFLVNLAPILILSAPSSVLPVELATSRQVRVQLLVSLVALAFIAQMEPRR
jgi:hypothetical protein